VAHSSESIRGAFDFRLSEVRGWDFVGGYPCPRCQQVFDPNAFDPARWRPLEVVFTVGVPNPSNPRRRVDSASG
jgi:hypothetical protein